ncbi:MAG: hypothetical protein NUW01_13345, partial [Gemmatimonadaceae bacterium]|nr:hypothetical protein [Gemmatimonadaceae bacterium]
SVVAGALVTSGFNVTAIQKGDGTWTIVAQSKDGSVDASAAANFAVAQSVLAKINSAEFI